MPPSAEEMPDQVRHDINKFKMTPVWKGKKQYFSLVEDKQTHLNFCVEMRLKLQSEAEPNRQGRVFKRCRVRFERDEICAAHI